MAGLIKNQILKHLSKFTKNLAADKINLSTLKGEGDLTDLVLDELVLTDLLDLPTWLRLTRASCNRLTIKIQWTKLSSQPICLYLDEVVVEMDTCDTPRTPTSVTPVSSYSTGGKYGFAEQIIDGMCVSINSIVVNFRAKDFSASIQMSRILIQSRTPCWQAGSLKQTRLKDELSGDVMIFKEAEWQTLRVEANACDTGELHLLTTPLRLIANQSKIRIVIKKKIADCSIVASRLQVNLDDLLWVLTNSQLKAALIFASSLRDVVAKSNEQSKRLAAEKLRKQTESPIKPSGAQSAAQLTVSGSKAGSPSQQKKAELFAKFDIKETSFHVYTGRIELHLCDDMGPDDGDRQKKVTGGAIQLVLEKLAFDSYPYHRAGADRSHWLRRDQNMMARDEWSRDLLAEFKRDVLVARDAIASNNNSPVHGATPTPTSGPGQSRPNMSLSDLPERQRTGSKPSVQSTMLSPTNTSVSKATASRLLESSIVVRLEDFALYRVSSAIDDRRSAPTKFLASDKKHLLLPKNMSSIHVDFTEYYFPDGKDFPDDALLQLAPDSGFLVTDTKGRLHHLDQLVPHSNLFIIVNPICLMVDYITIEWLNAFMIDLANKAVQNLGKKDEQSKIEVEAKSTEPVHVDIRLEALMPRVILPPTTSLDVDIARQFEGLEGLQIQISKAIVSNCRTGDAGKRLRSELQTLLESLNHGHLTKELNAAEMFVDPNSPSAAIFDGLRRHAGGNDSLANGVCQTAACYLKQSPNSSDVARQQGNGGLRADLLHVPASSDIWSAEVDQIWVEFIVAGHSARRQRTLPFVESFPAVIWMAPIAASAKHGGSSSSFDGFSTSSFTQKPADSVVSDRCVLARAGGSRDIQLQIDHKRLAFLMSLISTIAQVKEEIDMDLASASTVPPSFELIVSAITSDVRIDLLLLPVDEYSMRPASPDDDDEIEVPGTAADSVVDISSSRVITDLDSISSQQQNFDLTLSSGVVEDLDTPAGSLLQPPTVRLSGPDPCYFSGSVQDLTSASPAESSQLGTAFSGSHGLQSYSSNDSMKSTSADSERVLIGAPGMSFGMSDGQSSRHHSRPASNQFGSQQQQQQQQQRGPSRHGSAFGMAQQSADLKKSFTDAIGKIGDKIKVRRQDTGGRMWGDSDLDGWDTLSQRSDFASDDDDDSSSFIYQLESQDELPAFDHPDLMMADDGSVAASDTREDASDICSEIKSPNRKVISVASIYLCGIEAMVKINGNDIAVDSVIDCLTVKEHGNMTVEKFQEFFSSGGNKEKCAEVLAWSRRPSPLARLHVDIGQLAKRLVKGSLTVEDARYLTLSVCNVDLTLRVTTLTNLNEMFNDGKEPKIFPMHVDAADIHVTLLDDQKSKYNDVPTMMPIKFCIKTVSVQRDEAGVFHISSVGINPLISTALSSSVAVPSIESSFIGTANFDSLLDQTLYAAGFDRRKSDASSVPPDVAARLADLEHENDILRRQLEKIGKLDGLAIERSSRPSSRDRRESSTGRSGSTGGRKEIERLKSENLDLVDRLRDVEDEVQALRQERESLLLTIQLLQDDLTSSERQRQRTTSTI